MNIRPLTVSPAFRACVFDVYPELVRQDRFARLFAYMLAPSWVEYDTGNPILSWETLAHLDGQEHQLAARNYDGTAYVNEYQRVTGHSFEITPHSYIEGRARTVTDLRLDPRVHAAWREELLTPPEQPVEFVTGRKNTRQRTANLRQQDLQDANLRRSKYPETQAAIDYMNRVPPHRASAAMRAHGAEAICVAEASTNPVKRKQDLETLWFMRDQPKQFFCASRRDRGRRLFPAHRGYGSLSKEIAAIVGQDQFELDLRSSQLAICAYLWKVEVVIAFLETGGSIWEEFYQYLRVDKAAKPPLKDALYALLYGASRRRIVDDLEHSPWIDEACATKTARRLLRHPFMVALQTARDEQLAQIRADGGAWDCYGTWVAIPEDRNRRGMLAPNPRSVLATLAQAIEFKILSPVFELAASTDDFYITHFAHDGFCLDFTDQRRIDRWLQRITAAVNAQASALGIQTVLEVTRDPRQARKVAGKGDDRIVTI